MVTHAIGEGLPRGMAQIFCGANLMALRKAHSLDEELDPFGNVLLGSSGSEEGKTNSGRGNPAPADWQVPDS